MTVFSECCQLRTVTPEQATQWLDTVTPGYRRPSPAMVDRLTRLMDDEQWRMTPTDPIRLDVTGRLRGGRMRLLAVARHGKPVQMWVETSPPLRPEDRTPAAYVDIDPLDGTPLGRTQLEAMRYDGGNTDDIRAWVMAQPGDVTGLTDDGHGWLRLIHTGGIGAELWAYPGDWIARMHGGGYLLMAHPAFIQAFRKDEAHG